MVDRISSHLVEHDRLSDRSLRLIVRRRRVDQLQSQKEATIEFLRLGIRVLSPVECHWERQHCPRVAGLATIVVRGRIFIPTRLSHPGSGVGRYHCTTFGGSTEHEVAWNADSVGTTLLRVGLRLFVALQWMVTTPIQRIDCLRCERPRREWLRAVNGFPA